MENNEFIQITSLKHLLDILNTHPDEAGEFFLQLNYGVRSWKNISLADDNTIWVLNQIDETEDFIPIEALIDGTSDFIKYINAGALYFAWF